MIPIVTPAEMSAVDALHVGEIDTLIDRAGAAVARSAVRLLGGTYGRRVVVIAGKGNNGNDGRVAAERLRRLGVRVAVVDPDHNSEISGDLVIDAAYGTGLTREYLAPPVAAGTPVLAVDIASGIDGLTGAMMGRPLRATATVTFAAPKPGLLFGAGPEHCGLVEVADIGIDVSADLDACTQQGRISHTRTHLMTDDLVAAWWIDRPDQAHKKQTSTWVVGGSEGMTGAPRLAALGAQRCGAGYVRLSIPGVNEIGGPIEVVGAAIDFARWDRAVSEAADSGFKSLLIGPGLGRSDAAGNAVRGVISGDSGALPMVLDADALHLIGDVDLSPSMVLTPHDGEFRALTDAYARPDRIDSARAFAAERNAVVLLKGPTTVIAHPDGTAYCVTSGDARLATAGTGDVLAGMIAALLAVGHPPLRAAAIGAHLHGRAAQLGPSVGMVAGDLPDLVPAAIRQIVSP